MEAPEKQIPIRISQFFSDFFGLKFVPASAYDFERQTVKRGLPLYGDLRQKIRGPSVAHADEASWRGVHSRCQLPQLPKRQLLTPAT